jgi:glycosyltransferase involved in cell wall biosynthesis
MITIGMVVPTWGQQCGVADYAKNLMDAAEDRQIQFKVLKDLDEHFAARVMKESVDLIHFQFEYSIYEFDRLYQAMTEVNRIRIPIMATLHSWNSHLVSENMLLSLLSTVVIVHSEEMRQICIENGFPADKLLVRPLGSRSYQLLPADQTRRLFDISGFPRIGYFGFPFPHKGIGNLMEALNKLKVYFPDLKGYFFAHYPDYLDEEHPYFTFLKELQKQFDQQDHLVLIKEYLPESALVNLLHSMDINVLPYSQHFQKGISSAVRFMLGARKPVVATDDLYFSDLTDEVYKIEDDRAETIAEGIGKLLLDSNLQARLLESGDKFLQATRWEVLGYGYRNLYQQIMRERKGKENHG